MLPVLILYIGIVVILIALIFRQDKEIHDLEEKLDRAQSLIPGFCDEERAPYPVENPSFEQSTRGWVEFVGDPRDSVPPEPEEGFETGTIWECIRESAESGGTERSKPERTACGFRKLFAALRDWPGQ